jgi:Domain of unknown function (DUF4349)
MTAQQRKAAGLAGIIVAAGVVAVVVVPGGGSSGESAGSSSSSGSTAPGQRLGPASVTAPGRAASTVTAGAAASSGSGGSSGSAGSAQSADSVGTSATATRVVRTGQLSLRVSSVLTAADRLTALAGAAGGYVQNSVTTAGSPAATAEITLRVPAARFDATVGQAQRLGKTRSLTTSSTDVTGRYVDLVARATALRQTRSTYLTILSKATTIGATLSVQQRVDDVQQQLDRLEGQRQVLASQSNDATLEVSLNQRAVVVHAAPPVHTGIGAAWHRSIHRFSVGFDGIVGILGPLALAVLLLALLAAIGLLGYRGMRRLHRGSVST